MRFNIRRERNIAAAEEISDPATARGTWKIAAAECS
jgi:hypothetical protein